MQAWEISLFQPFKNNTVALCFKTRDVLPHNVLRGTGDDECKQLITAE